MTQEEEEETEMTSEAEEEEEPKAKKAKGAQTQTQPKIPDVLKVQISNNSPYRTSTEEHTTYGKTNTSRTGMMELNPHAEQMEITLTYFYRHSTYSCCDSI